MTEESNIQPIEPDFEQIKRKADEGQEYWSACELATALGYSTWQKFNRVLNKALQVALQSGMEMVEHFNHVVRWLVGVWYFPQGGESSCPKKMDN